ncbi:MAG: HAMP domain-containing histidine kinase [Coriobacteriia bacterium]|nr:HAMP domain-containing histidine kinase [Coriobacteriia bacterium]
MRRSSLRTTLLLVSVLFAMLVVGGIALTTYVIVSDGMRQVAVDTGSRLASTAEAVLRDIVASAEAETTARGLTGEVADEAALRLVASRLPEAMSHAGMSEATFALFDRNLELVWASDTVVMSQSQVRDRKLALASGLQKQSIGQAGDLFSGLLTDAKLGTTVNHTPVSLPGNSKGVLDVVHTPTSEERIIDAIRQPMAVLAIAAMAIMVLLMQTSMLWVLGLVDNLRKAADSIEAGRLDERLPVTGNSEITDLARSLNGLIERLQRRSEAQARFVADASHELATPVAGIRGYTSILRAWGADDPKVRDEAVDAIDRESRRMARLTADLLNLLHADQGLVLRSERFDLNALVRERLASSASRWMDKDIEFEGPEEDSLLMVGDPDRVEDIISILLDNASKYTPPGGSVSVHTRRKRDNVLLEVADTGQGIPAEDLPRVFDRFFRSEASRAAGEGGFGLGLAILRSIVESMGGDIHVSSAIGEGTVFTVRLPKGRV